MIKASQIHKSFANIKVLKGIDLHIQASEVVSIVGASGAGKSTLLQIIGTLESMDQGKVIINGIEIEKLKEKQLAEFRNQQIGFVFQAHHLLPEFTALENICIPAYIAKTNPKEAEARAFELLDFLNMRARADHKPNELSGGEQQRIAVARALINNPAVVLADEPSGNLDSEASISLHQLFFKLREQFKQTFVIVTHNQQLANMSDRILSIKDGMIA